jgi:hypothetical protein
MALNHDYDQFIGMLYSEVATHIETHLALDGYDMHVVFDVNEEVDNEEMVHIFVDPVTDRIYNIKVKE